MEKKTHDNVSESNIIYLIFYMHIEFLKYVNKIHEKNIKTVKKIYKELTNIFIDNIMIHGESGL